VCPCSMGKAKVCVQRVLACVGSSADYATRPMGFIEEDRSDQFLSLIDVRRDLESFWTLTDLPDRSSGPARYVHVAKTGGKLGFITPLTHNVCDSCRHVRASRDDGLLNATIDRAVAAKPKAHDFLLPVRGATTAAARHMSVTGG